MIHGHLTPKANLGTSAQARKDTHRPGDDRCPQDQYPGTGGVPTTAHDGRSLPSSVS
jgi:hypothetical protein